LTTRFPPTPILVSHRLATHLRQQILRGCTQARVLGEQCSAFVLNRADHVPHPIVLSAISTFHPLITVASERRSITNRLEAAKARHGLAQGWTRCFARNRSREQLRNFSTFFLLATHTTEEELRRLGDTTYVQQQAGPTRSRTCVKLDAIVWRAEQVRVRHVTKS
jgi:hypothetical protein